MVAKTVLPTKRVIDYPVTALRFDEQIAIILKWAAGCESKMVCVANVHMLIEAHLNPEFVSILESADMVTPDGMPLVWMMRRLGVRHQDRVAGMDIFQALCEKLQSLGVSVYCLGSQPEILSLMRQRLSEEYPQVQIAAMESLPFRPLTEAEDKALIKKINESGAGLVFISLDCPKQEKFMPQHKDKIQAVMIGLGGVFPVYAGIQKRAPRIVRDLGLEWLYRWIQEPRRLWKRYTQTIPPFMLLASKQLLSSSSFGITKNLIYRYLIDVSNCLKSAYAIQIEYLRATLYLQYQ